jgi:predicted aminopeptidase
MTPRRRKGLWAALTASTLLLGLATGCADLGYLVQSASGHVGVLWASRPVDDWLADPATPAALRERLQLSQRLRDFATTELGLPDNASYRRYADLGRSAVVWNVAAAPEFSLTLHTWCFPVAGCVGYRGYYREADAQAHAETLRAQGLETTVYPVPAYSTLGKLNALGGDPLLNTFIRRNEPDLAGLLFHELAHQVVYVPGDTTFNESYATTVERLGVRRWMQHAHGLQAAGAQQALTQQIEQRRQDWHQLLVRHRQRLEALYRQPLRAPAMRAEKTRLIVLLKDEYAQLQQRWGGYTGYDASLNRLNNATLGMQATYTQHVGAFEHLFQQQGQDFTQFHTRVRELAQLPSIERSRVLEQLASLRPALGASVAQP